jgi:hypothetical protein
MSFLFSFLTILVKVVQAAIVFIQAVAGPGLVLA